MVCWGHLVAQLAHYIKFYSLQPGNWKISLFHKMRNEETVRQSEKKGMEATARVPNHFYAVQHQVHTADMFLICTGGPHTIPMTTPVQSSWGSPTASESPASTS